MRRIPHAFAGHPVGKVLRHGRWRLRARRRQAAPVPCDERNRCRGERFLDLSASLLHDARASPREVSGPMTDIFDPTRYEGVRRPLLDAVSLPPWCYTSDAFYRREVDAILTRSWNLVGRVDEIPSPGDYRVFDLCGRSAIVVRGDDGEIRALANTCRHRGTRLLDDSGHCRAIICPYHCLDLPVRRVVVRLPRHGEDARVREGGPRPRPGPARHLGRVHLRVLLRRKPRPRDVARRPAGAVRLVPVRDLRAGAPQALRPRLQLEALHRERDGGLPHPDRAQELDRPAGDGPDRDRRRMGLHPHGERGHHGRPPRRHHPRSRTSKGWKAGPRRETRSPSSTRRRSSAPRKTACGGYRRSRTARAGAA